MRQRNDICVSDSDSATVTVAGRNATSSVCNNYGGIGTRAVSVILAIAVALLVASAFLNGYLFADNHRPRIIYINSDDLSSSGYFFSTEESVYVLADLAKKRATHELTSE